MKSINDSHEEASCKSEILFKDNDNYCLSKIVGQHEGSGNDSKGASIVLYKLHLSYTLGLGMKIDNDQMTHMYGNVNISGSVNIKDSLKIENNLSIGGASIMDSTLSLAGAMLLISTLAVAGKTTFYLD